MSVEHGDSGRAYVEGEKRIWHRIGHFSETHRNKTDLDLDAMQLTFMLLSIIPVSMIHALDFYMFAAILGGCRGQQNLKFSFLHLSIG